MSIFRKKVVEPQEEVVYMEKYDIVFHMKNGQHIEAHDLVEFPSEYKNYPGLYWLKWPTDPALKTQRWESIRIENVDKMEIKRTTSELVFRKTN